MKNAQPPDPSPAPSLTPSLDVGAQETQAPDAESVATQMESAMEIGDAETIGPDFDMPSEIPLTVSDDPPTIENAPTLAPMGGAASDIATFKVERAPESALSQVPDALYERGDELARGGMGRIILARDRRLRRPVAIKELLGGGERAQQRFEREALITARLQHPGIVNIYEAGRWPSGESFYTMEKVNGEPFEAVIEATSSLTERLSLVPHLLDVADAMAYAHAQRVIHRDLKPANVLIGAFGECVVIDWGLAKVLGSDDDEALEGADVRDLQSEGPGLTMAGSVMGTPGYMPPEQAEGTHVDERADVYALGAMLYHLLAGRPPYEGQSSRAVLLQLLSEEPPLLLDIAPDVPPELHAIVQRAMKRDLSLRYPNAGALAEDLRRFLNGKLVGAHHYSAWSLARRWLRRHRAVVSVVSVALIALVIMGVFSLNRVIEASQVARDQRAIAEDQRAVAQTRQREAEQAHARSRTQTARTTLMQARRALTDDPTAALAWLKQLDLPASHHLWASARTIAAHAASLDVAQRVLRGHRRVSHRVALTPDDSHLISSSEDGTLRIWDLAETHGRAEVIEHAEGLDEFFAVSPDARWIAMTTRRHRRVVLIDRDSGRVRETSLTNATRVAFHPDFPLLAIGTQGGDVHVISTQNLSTFGVFPEREGAVETLRFTPDGIRLAVSSVGSPLRFFDVKTGQLSEDIGVTDVDSESDSDLVFSRDGQWGLRVDRGGFGQAPELIHASDRKKNRIIDAAPGFQSAAFSPDGAWIALAYPDRVELVSTGEEGERQLESSGAIEKMRFSADGHHVAASVSGGGVRLWDLERPQGFELRLDLKDAVVFQFSQRSPLLVTTHRDGTLRLRDLSHPQEELQTLETSPELLATHPGVAYIGDDNGAIWRWDLTDNAFELFARLDEGQTLLALTLSSDGQRLAAQTSEGLVLWTREGEEVQARSVPGGHRLHGAVLSPNGAWLASVSVSDGGVKLFDLQDEALAGTQLYSDRMIAVVSQEERPADRLHPDARTRRPDSVIVEEEMPEETEGGSAGDDEEEGASGGDRGEAKGDDDGGGVSAVDGESAEEARAEETDKPEKKRGARKPRGRKTVRKPHKTQETRSPDAPGDFVGDDERRGEPETSTNDAPAGRVKGIETDPEAENTRHTTSENHVEGQDPDSGPEVLAKEEKTDTSDTPEKIAFGEWGGETDRGGEGMGRGGAGMGRGGGGFGEASVPDDVFGQPIGNGAGSNFGLNALGSSGQQVVVEPEIITPEEKPGGVPIKKKPKPPIDSVKPLPGQVAIPPSLSAPDKREQGPGNATSPAPPPSTVMPYEELASGPGITRSAPPTRVAIAQCQTLSAALLRFSPDGRWVATALECGDVLKLWDVQTQALRQIEVADAERITDVVFSQTHAFIAGGSRGPVIVELSSGDAVVIEGRHAPTLLALSPDGRWLAGATDRGQAVVWDLTEQVPPRVLDAESLGHLEQLTFSPDGAQLAAIVAGQTERHAATAVVWDIDSGDARPLLGHRDRVIALAFVSDRAIVTIGADQTARLWRDDVPTDPVALQRWLDEATSMRLLEEG